MQFRYAYKYAKIRESDGMCIGSADTTEYIVDRIHVPVPNLNVSYVLKYYWPIPDVVTSHDDWQGLWYLDAAHTQLFDEGNANQ